MKKIVLNLKNFLFQNLSEEQRIVKNSFWLGLARFGGSLLRALLIIFAFRILGPSLQGSFSLAMNFVLIFSFIPDFGLTAILIRELSKNQEKKKEIFANALLGVVFLLLLSLILINLTKNIFIKDHLALKLIFILSLFLIFDTLREFLYALFRAKEKMEFQAFSHLSTNFLLLTFGLFFLRLKPEPFSLVLAYFLASFFGFLLTIFLLRKEIFYNYFKFFQIKITLSFLNKSWPIGMANFLFLVLTYLDSLIIGWFHTPKDVGLYSSIVKLIEFLYFFPAALAMSIFPVVAKKENQEIEKTLNFGFQVGLLISLPLFIGLFVLAKEIINFLFGSQYLAAYPALKLISFSLPLNFFLLILINVLIALDKRKELLFYDLLVVFFNFVLNLLFVPRFSFYASALIVSFSSLFSLIFAYSVLKKHLDFSLKIKFFNYIFASMLMGFLIYFLPLHLVFKIIFGMVFYFFLLFILKDDLILKFLKLHH